MQDPETELALAHTELDNLQRRLDASRELDGRAGLGPQTESAERSWRNAQTFYDHKEWLSTVRELSNYLNQTQVPESTPYLKAQLMLGHSYEELGLKSKALRAYFRYLATFLTSKEQDHGELVEVLRRMLPLAAAENDKRELNQLLASVTSLELPPDTEPAILFYAAKAATNSGSQGLAATWLDTSIKQGKDPSLKAKALYVQALLQLAKGDEDGAADTLTLVIQTDKDGQARDAARLALARLAVHQKKRETALKYYALVPEESPSFKEATFESAYVALDLKQDEEARAKAVLYVARWPESPEALQLRLLLAYLDMRAGDLDSAGKGIAAADHRLHEIDDWIVHHLSGRTTINQTTLTDLITLTGGQLPVAPSVKEAAEIFARLAEAARRVADIRGELKNTLFTVGRANIEHLRPAWVNRAEQLAKLGDDLLEVGHRLAATERHLYDDRLDGVDRQRLVASESRRTRLLTPPAAARRRMQYWASYAEFMDLTRGVAQSYDRLQQAQAELATARYLADTAQNVKEAESRRSRLAELQAKTQRLKQVSEKALTMLRSQRVESLLAESPHRATGRFLSQYAAALHEESLILAQARDNAKTTAQRLNAEDAAKAWQQWEFLAGELFRQLDGLDKEIGGGLKGLLAEIESEEQRADELDAKVHEITGQLEAQLGQSLSYIVDQYTAATQARFAHHQKWRADIDWLTYQSQLDADRKLNDRINLEQQILKDNLTDLQQGVLWQWPK